MRRLFGVRGPVPNFPTHYNAAPTQSLPVVKWNPETSERTLDLLRWGLIPSWAKDAKIASSLINARAEGVAVKPSFRTAFAKRRCLVPADAFYEWRAGTKPKQPYAIRMKSGETFALAGLWENWKDGEGQWVRTYTIVTTAANELLAPLHDRMPVIVDPTDYGKWLGEVAADPTELTALMKPYQAELMKVYRVGLAVSNVRNDEASLLKKVETI